MTCQSCGASAIGLLEGEPVCAECAAMVSLTRPHAMRAAFWRIWFKTVAIRAEPIDPERWGRPYSEAELRALRAQSKSDEVFDEIRERFADHAFYANARKAFENGGCRG